jgi:hypothetical protein
MKALIITLVIFCTMPLNAEVRIFLYPTVEHDSTPLKVCDIAFIENNEDTAVKVREIIIDRSIFKDGFIDRRELETVLSKKGPEGELYTIFGTATRILPKEDDPKPEREIIVYKGDRVGVTVQRKGILVELNGTLLSDAAAGDRVTVELSKNRYIKGILSAARIVEVRI